MALKGTDFGQLCVGLLRQIASAPRLFVRGLHFCKRHFGLLRGQERLPSRIKYQLCRFDQYDAA